MKVGGGRKTVSGGAIYRPFSSADWHRFADLSRQQRTGQSGATMHAEFCIDAALVRDDRAGRYPPRIRNVPARQIIPQK